MQGKVSGPPVSFGHPPNQPHRQGEQPPEHEELEAEFSNFSPEGPLELTVNYYLSYVFPNQVHHIYLFCIIYTMLVLPEQHFCAAILRSTSVHLGEAILD